MMDLYIFDIPIYRVTEAKYYADRETSTRKQLERLRIPRETAPNSYAGAEQYFREAYGGPWDFNEIVGWIRLYAEPSHVGGHLWRVKAKRLQRRTRKTFWLISASNMLATYFTPKDDSHKIFTDTLSELTILKKKFKGRYIDLETFRNLGPFINWRELLNSVAHHSDLETNPAL